MISKVKASSLLNNLVGLTDLSASSAVYLGLCSAEPAHDNGAITGEPVGVGGYGRKTVVSSRSSEFFGQSSNNGIITNKKEIQMPTALEDYPEKITHWFLSGSLSGDAYMWGIIKDVLREPELVEGFADAGVPGVHGVAITSRNLLDLVEGEKYIVLWDGEEYEVEAKVTTYGEMNGISLGELEDVPFGVFYSEVTDGLNTNATFILGSTDLEATEHTFAIYGIGINVKKATVPTFYANQLKASIDVDLT